MPAAVRAATASDLEAVARYLSTRLQGGPPERYRRFFEYPWLVEKPNLGWLIEDGGEVRAFLGAIYATRRVHGSERTFCNINSWSVDEAYRKLSLFMLQQLLAQPAHKETTFTCLSPSEKVAECLRFFKFSLLDEEKVLLSPLSGWAARVRKPFPRIRVLRGDRVRAELDEAQRRTYDDHRAYARLGHFVLMRGERRCYVVTGRRGRGAKAFADVLHASDPELFSECVAALHVPVALRHRTGVLGVDARFLPRRPRTSVTYRGLRPTMFRSPSLSSTDVDALYSEFAAIYG